MKRFLLTLLKLALVVILAALALAPVALGQYRLWENAKIAAGYLDAAEKLTLLECDAMRLQVEARNEALESDSWSDPYTLRASDSAGAGPDEAYASLLNPAGDGVLALLEVPKLGLSLPVYRDGENETSHARVEHVASSRLPSTGKDGLCLLRATRERFFDPFAGIGRLIPGDCFFLKVLRDTLTYEVLQVEEITPEALMELPQVRGDDECALVAEAPGGKRLVVRGRRAPRQRVMPTDDSRALPVGIPEIIFAAPLAVAGLALLMVVEWLRRIALNRKRRRMKL